MIPTTQVTMKWKRCFPFSFCFCWSFTPFILTGHKFIYKQMDIQSCIPHPFASRTHWDKGETVILSYCSGSPWPINVMTTTNLNLGSNYYWYYFSINEGNSMAMVEFRMLRDYKVWMNVGSGMWLCSYGDSDGSVTGKDIAVRVSLVSFIFRATFLWVLWDP